jgi:hypothetical protein
LFLPPTPLIGVAVPLSTPEANLEHSKTPAELAQAATMPVFTTFTSSPNRAACFKADAPFLSFLLKQYRRFGEERQGKAEVWTKTLYGD